METICIDGSFTADTLEFYKKYGVSVPQQDKIYNFRDVINHASKTAGGETIGVLLEEIINPNVPIYTPILGETWREPTFSIKRFAKLDGSEITKEEIKELSLQKVKIDEYKRTNSN